jgi:hypothetical protein
MRIAILLMAYMLAEGTLAQESPSIIRRIAPERFQPNPRSDSEQSAGATSFAPPTKENPFGGCDRASRGWLICLRSTADLSNLMEKEAETRIVASLDQRQNVNLSLQRVFAKAMADADAQWLALREQECSQLALLEFGPRTPFYEAQLLCQIRRNVERVDQLSTRYGAGAR